MTLKIFIFLVLVKVFNISFIGFEEPKVLETVPNLPSSLGQDRLKS